jgi:hypothetical protein
LVDRHERMRWYNPASGEFKEGDPQSDEEALRLLEGSLHPAACKDTYQEWRALGAGVKAALIRASEAAKEERV